MPSSSSGSRTDSAPLLTIRPILDALRTSAVLLDPDGVLLLANATALRLLDRSDEELRGRPALDVLFAEQESGAAAEVLAHVRSVGQWEGELEVAVRTGARRTLRLSCATVRDGGAVTGMLIVLEDVGGSRAQAGRLAERLTRLARVTSELLLTDDVDGVTQIVVEHMADAAGATVASLSLLVDDQTLRLMGLRGGREGASGRWETFSVHGTPAGDSVRSRQPLVLTGRDEIASKYPGLETAAEGDRSLVCLPLLAPGRAIGVATMSFPGRRSISGPELEFFRVMADACAQALVRVQALADSADRASKLRFLADATEELSSSLDYESTLRKVAQLAVPWFADWCSISLDADGELRTLAVAHVDPAKVALAEEFERRYPADPRERRGSYEVFRTGLSELTPEITDEMLRAAIDDEEQLELVRELNLFSAMAVPLKVKDRVLGVVTWVAGENGRRFGPHDLEFGEDLARRAAVAIDNAQLHTEMREMAVRLQRAVLPSGLPTIDGWDMAAHYSPSGQLNAGGDFYDVIPLGEGRLAFFVGDVMGRGVRAAAAMAQMRSAIRALVAVDPAPDVLLPRLDLLFDQYELNQLVTMVYAVADPSRDELVVANAGHPAPVILPAQGEPFTLAATDEVLLGAGGGDRSTRTVRFAPGDLALAFTDGLIERRDEDIDVGEKRLVDAAVRLSDGLLDRALLEVIDAVRDATRDDDVAALAVRRRP